MRIPNIFIFGAGYSGKAFARTNTGGAEVVGTTRSPEKFAVLRQAGIEPLLFDGSLNEGITAALKATTHLVISIAPDEAGDPVLNAASTMIREEMPALRWIGYLSTVGVYGDHGGDWVDETSACRPVSNRSRRRVDAERQWLDTGGERRVPTAVLRLSGIYGPGRNAFVNLTNGSAKRLIKPGQVFNRIHVDDIAGALWHLAAGEKGGVFNLTDDLPAPPQDVVSYAAALMGIAPPPEIDFETAELSPMARSFYGANKRVSNAAVKREGYRFRFPDYRAAFEAMWQSSNWADGAMRSPMKRS